MRSLVTLALTFALVLAACSDTADPIAVTTSSTQPPSASDATPTTSLPTTQSTSGEPSLSSTSSSVPTAASTTSSSSTTTTQPPDDVPSTPLGQLPLRRTLIAEGFTQPVGVAHRPGHVDLYIADQDGEVWRLTPGAQPELWLSLDVTFGGEQGLLSVAFSPDGDEVFVAYSNDTGATTVDRWTIGADGTPTDRRQVISVAQPLRNHNGGHIAFGPDGYLWLGLGDGGGADDQLGNGQNPDTLLGSMVRIDVSQEPYAVPADNPYVDGGGAPEAYMIGLRNPWRFSFDGDDLWIADVGQNEWEEINLLPAASAHANLGWPILEATHCFQAESCDAAGTVLPVYEYRHEAGRCSVTGGYVYRGDAIPDLQDSYLFGDYCSGEVFGIRVDAEGLYDQTTWPDLTSQFLTSFGVDSSGELYFTTASGQVWRIDA